MAILTIAFNGQASGRIVVAGDDWPFFDEGFDGAPDAPQFARNIAAWFAQGNPGKFLSSSGFSAARGTGQIVVNVFRDAGYSWTVNDSLTSFSLSNLMAYRLAGAGSAERCER